MQKMCGIETTEEHDFCALYWAYDERGGINPILPLRDLIVTSVNFNGMMMRSRKAELDSPSYLLDKTRAFVLVSERW